MDYGLSPVALELSVSGAALVTAHALALDGLMPGATYYYRASSTDAAGNGATAPPVGEEPASFLAPLAVCAVDDLTADFAAGAPSGTWIAETGNGELILAPTSGGEFGGSALAGDWESGLRAGDGVVQVSGGRLRLGAAWAGTLAYLPAGRSLEFVATFTSEIQHARLRHRPRRGRLRHLHQRRLDIERPQLLGQRRRATRSRPWAAAT